MKQIAYYKADKYLVAELYSVILPFAPDENIITGIVDFYKDGTFVLHENFNYSANFPAINTEDSRRASAEHDGLYWLMKIGLLDRKYKTQADYRMYDVLREDGMIDFRAWYWCKAVLVGGDNALDSPMPKKLYAPSAKTLPAGHQLKDALKV